MVAAYHGGRRGTRMTSKNPKPRTITQLIKRARTKGRINEIAEKWIDGWQAEQAGLIDRLGNAVAKKDFDEQCICTGELRKITEKRFAGLKNAAKEIIGRINDGNDNTDTGRN